MAYIYFNNYQANSTAIYCICETESDIQNFTITNSLEQVEISNDDFLKLKRGTHQINTRNGTTFTWTNMKNNTEGAAIDFYQDSDALQRDLTHISSVLDTWLTQNESNARHSDVQSYKNFVDNFDVNSLTFPNSKTWGEICEDNSQTYFCFSELPR